VICEYLDELAGGGVLIPRDAPRRWRVLTNHAIAQGMCESVILIRYETWLRPEGARWSVWIDDHWDKIHSGLYWFERNSHELNEPINLAHLALGSVLGYIDFRWPDYVWREPFSNVSSWFERLEMRPSFAKTKPELPPSL
jgi:glutathione S-transferase